MGFENKRPNRGGEVAKMVADVLVPILTVRAALKQATAEGITDDGVRTPRQRFDTAVSRYEDEIAYGDRVDDRDVPGE